ncbi:MAG: hypothetical protein E8D45_11680 [Nitrospira sp.]|nr:MAG: hypothetical protein E8D45_11680 [Nitrospira sp.]
MSVKGSLATLIAGCFIGILTLDAHAVATKPVKVTIANAGPRASVTIKATDGSFQKTEEAREDADRKVAAYFEVDTDKPYDIQVLAADGTYYEARNQRLTGEVTLDTKTMTQSGGGPAVTSSPSFWSREYVRQHFPGRILSRDSDLPTDLTLDVGAVLGTNWGSLGDVATRTSGGATELSGFKQAETLTGGLDATLWWLNGWGGRVGYLHSQNDIKPGRVIEGGAASGFVDIPGTSVVHDIFSLSAMYRCTCLIFRPYIGIGMDIARTSMTNGMNSEINHAVGFNAQAGASYPIPGIKGVRVGLDYFLHRFGVENDRFNAGPGNTNIAIDGTQTIHGFNGTIRYEFDALRFLSF